MLHGSTDNGSSRASFAEGVRIALGNAQLQRALSNATTKHKESRDASLSVIGPEWERMRERAREVKEHTLAHLDHYLEEFAANVERRGGSVFWADDAAEANRYITSLALSRGVRLAVKSKSMMTEEIELNGALASAGVEAVETDLGEYIVQLAGERPSHITAPAIHKSRGEIASLFTDKLGVACADDTEQITAVARRALRERFARAGMGITGVNFAVAETGTIVLVENEGNIRMATTLPRVHVALMSIEKVIPLLEDVDVFLQVLPRAASGQKITSYVSFLTGTKPAPHEEGPDELHVVILDNGRTEILGNAHLRESLNCIRCGACLNACPVYQKIGGHAYGWIYPGPIGAILTPQLLGRERAADLPFASTLCGACRDVCPVKIDIPGMLLQLRHEIKEPAAAVEPHAASDAHAARASAPQSSDPARRQDSVHPRGFPSAGGGRGLGNRAEKLMFRVWAMTVKRASRYRLAARLARLAQKLAGAKDGSRNSPWPLSRWTDARDMKKLPARSFREQWAASGGRLHPRAASPRPRIDNAHPQAQLAGKNVNK